MAQNLLERAHDNTLPDFQYLDNATYAWILLHNPKYSQSCDASRLPQHAQAIISLPLPKSFFADPRMYDSLHGIRHARRVAYFCYLLGHISNMDAAQLRDVTIAGLLHDIRRQNDKSDPGHGKASADWFKTNHQTISRLWKMPFSPESGDMIHMAIASHDQPYDNIEKSFDKDTHGPFVDIVKTADALDRYRLPKLTWWIDDQRLKNIPPAWLKQLAYDTVTESEYEALVYKNADSVVSTLRKKGLA